MLNQFHTVGRMISDIIMIDNKRAKVRLSVPTPIKNDDGDYVHDTVEFLITGKMIEMISEHCKKGDLLGVKGFLSSQEMDGVMMPTLMTEKVTFLSSKVIDSNDDMRPELEEANIAL